MLVYLIPMLEYTFAYLSSGVPSLNMEVWIRIWVGVYGKTMRIPQDVYRNLYYHQHMYSLFSLFEQYCSDAYSTCPSQMPTYFLNSSSSIGTEFSQKGKILADPVRERPKSKVRLVTIW